MKFFAYIFSLLLLTIAISPAVAFSDHPEKEISCCDSHCSSETAEDSKSLPDEQECGFCNPFFNCACYSGVIVQEGAFLAAGDDFLYVQKSIIYKDLTPFQVHPPFWQPPKISA